MSDNQMIKIEFDFDLGNVPASAKKFAQYLKDVNVNLDFTKKSVKELGDGLDQVGKKMNESGNIVKKSNQQWTNFALIIQDLPYGFRAIQNNLPAVLGSIAGATGPIYLLGSAVVAFFAAVDNGLIKFGNSTKTAENYSKSFASTLAEETTKLESLYRVSTDSTRSMSDRLEAAKELKKEYPGLLGKYSEEEIALGKAKEGYIDLSKTIAMYAKAKAAEKMIVDITAKSLENEYKINKIIADAGPEPRRFQGNRTTSAYLLYQAKIFNQTKDLRAEQSQLSDENKYYTKILDDNVNAMSRLSAAQDDGKKNTKKLEDSTIGLLRAKQQYYKDDIIMYAAYEQEILKREEDLAAKQAQVDGKSATDIENIHKTYEQLRINSAEVAGNKILDIQRKLGEEEGKENEKIAEMQQQGRELIAKSILKINKDFAEQEKKDYKERIDQFSQYYNNLIDFATGNRLEQKAIYEQQLFDLDNLLYNNLITWDDYYKLLGDLTKAWANNNKAIVNEAFANLLEIGNGIMSALGGSLDMLISKGASLGEVLTSAFQDLLKQLLKVTIAAGIAVALIAILFPGKLAQAGGAMKLFSGLFSQGMGLGKNLFASPTANGGVFSGPSYRLVGEYPGAKNNPEVVAPLDKLKSMIGGGGSGEFVLRGNDLVLALQRSNSSLTLRR
jgi:hypothetical protein